MKNFSKTYVTNHGLVKYWPVVIKFMIRFLWGILSRWERSQPAHTIFSKFWVSIQPSKQHDTAEPVLRFQFFDKKHQKIKVKIGNGKDGCTVTRNLKSYTMAQNFNMIVYPSTDPTEIK
jgi:hypothetical protein